MLTEKLELLGKGLYTDIPDEITLTNIPTASELEQVGSEDFMKTMVNKIFPEAIVEDFDYGNLLEIDYHWTCRCLRLLNYGYYHTTNQVWCSDCGQASYGEYRVNLTTIGCKELPQGFVNEFRIKKDEFVDFNSDVVFKILTVKELLAMFSDKGFKDANGKTNEEFGRICYMIKEINGKKGIGPAEVKHIIKNNMIDADYRVLKETAFMLSDYGIRAGGTCTCPKCGSETAAFMALVDDRFFRPTVGDLREWANDRRQRKSGDVSGNTKKDV
jgi:hypothetical protein